jgi:hypothetical protein
MAILDARLDDGRLQARRVGPRVLGPAYAAPLPYVEEQADVRRSQRVQEPLEREAVHAYGCDVVHLRIA